MTSSMYCLASSSKWPQKHANKDVGICLIVKESPQVSFKLEHIQHQIEFCALDLNKIYLYPTLLKSLCLTADNTVVILGR